MKRIPLTQNQFAMVDDEDFKPLSKYKWHAHKDKCSGYYAGTNVKGKSVLMHRLIFIKLGLEFEQIDHIDHDTLNNCKANLRPCKKSENARNQKVRRDNQLGLKGVYKHPDGKFMARVTINRQRLYLGLFADPIDAARAYNIKALEVHGEYAFLNKV